MNANHGLYLRVKDLVDSAFSDYAPADYEAEYNCKDYNKAIKEFNFFKNGYDDVQIAKFDAEMCLLPNIEDYNTMYAYIVVFEDGGKAQMEWQRQVEAEYDAYRYVNNLR